MTRKRKGRGDRPVAERFQLALVCLVLIGVGALLGSFWLEWRHARLDDGRASDPGADPLADRLKVEVLNGSGDRGAAARIRDHLRARGFDVVSVDNADHFDHAVTHVLNRSGRPGAARDVASRMGVDSVANAFDPDLFLDATVILGEDWLARLAAATDSSGGDGFRR